MRNRGCCVTVASLVGVKLASQGLQATTGETVDLATLSGRSVIFVYPYTGVPGIPDPEGWDGIPGAHGSTPQALAFSYRYSEFVKLGVKVFGVSLQDTTWQREFLERTQLAFPLLSDGDQVFSQSLGLETFKAGNRTFLIRRTLVLQNGIVTHDIYPVPKPAANAVDVLELLSS